MSDMDYLPDLLTALQADSTLTTTLTGGMYLKRTLANRLTHELEPAAYDASGYLKPLLIIKGRRDTPFGGKDNSDGFQIIRQPIEFWFHNDKDAGYTALNTAAARLYTLINLKPYAGATQFVYAGGLEFEDPALNDAATLLREYTLIGSRRG